MGRRKTVTVEQILDAAEIVVANVGPVGLTLDAVAKQAGIGKATVVYDFKTKQALIEALVKRIVEADNQFNQKEIEKLQDKQDAVLFGRINAAAQPFPEAFKDVALSLCAALAQNTALRNVIQENQTKVVADIMATSSNPRSARLAYMALEGLKLLESLDYFHWSETERQEIISDIRQLTRTPLKTEES